ncbi:MAG: glycosyltransferase [Pseudomonadota bacterium]
MRGKGSYPTIAATMIVKDEASFLGACLQSLSEHVDEIVVVDTGSTDSTLEIARRFDCKISEVPWEGDFAAARNQAFRHTNADWCLYIDADERLSVPEGQTLGSIVDDVGAAAYFVRFVPKLGFTPYHEIRLYRNDPRIRFFGSMHETVHDAIQQVCLSDGLTIEPSDVAIEHHGYEGDQSNKHDRNLPLLKRAILEQPERAFIWAHLGDTLARLGRTGEARDALRKAIELSDDNENLKQKTDGSVAWTHLIELELASDPEQAASLAKVALERYPEHHAIYLQYASAMLRCGSVANAVPILEKLISIDADNFFDPLAAYDKRVFGEWAYGLLGDAHLMLGDKELALDAFNSAVELNPDCQEYRVKAAICQ